MGESGGNPETLLVLGTQNMPVPLTKCRRVSAKIDKDIKNRTLRHPDQFSLRSLDLIMEPAQHIFGRAGVIVLNEVLIDAYLGKLLSIPGLKEKPTVIAEDLGLQAIGAVDFSGVTIHEGKEVEIGKLKKLKQGIDYFQKVKFAEIRV